MLVSWSPQPPETAARSCAGTQERWEEAGSGRAALSRHRHLASHPRCRRLARVLGPRRGSSSPGQDGPGQLLLRLQGGSHRRRAGAERGRAADPGPQEEREAPSPPPGGSGGRQAAVRPSEPSCLSPTPGPGTRAGTPRHQPQAPGPWCWMHPSMSVSRAGGGRGSARGDPQEATSSSPPASPLCRRGTTLRPQLRLALDQLWVLSGGKEAAGEEEEEEEGSDEDRTSIILIWPTGSCVAAFGSQALKELWVGTLLGTPGGAKRARVTRLPSLRPLEKELSRRHAWRSFSARSLERLMEDQAEVRMGGGGTRNASTSSLAALGGNLPGGAESPGGQGVPALLRSGCWCRVAACRWPFLLRGCSLSAARFLQDHPKQGPPTAPSVKAGGLCRSPGEFWKETHCPANG
ncbi:uncharacterized protein LOC126036902 isoform X2 [Accipiter gentilis]|uniref:uncharacterized protein LOC126036798 isoform X2 n=1 Tax=Astur gentilis TaxID=8957 RepID=UPI00210FA8BE|nr:uncharacterized protein LOC126036798 isoform X2 [Accipiter gentilis]XP_049653072.1 uncharacterized protein LOC126036902 isoform X2 [Accipiter gentilis]